MFMSVKPRGIEFFQVHSVLLKSVYTYWPTHFSRSPDQHCQKIPARYITRVLYSQTHYASLCTLMQYYVYFESIE